MATSIYDVLAGQRALDVFNESVYPSGDPETRGGIYSRAKQFGGLAQLANTYLEMAGLPPTQENYNIAFRALGAGATIPVRQEVPEGRSAMTAYFDRLLGRTPEQEEKKETLKEIIQENESEDPDLSDFGDPTAIDPNDPMAETIANIVGPGYSIGELFGMAAGIPGSGKGSYEAAREREQKALEGLFGKDVVSAADKAKAKERGISLENLVGALMGVPGNPVSRISDPDLMAKYEDLYNVGNIDKGGDIEGLFGPEYEGFTREDFGREGETFSDDEIGKPEDLIDTTPPPAPVHSDDEPPSDPSNPTGLSEEEKDELDTMF